MQYYVTFKQTFDGQETILCKVADSTEMLIRWLGFMEDGDLFELISIVPKND